MAEIKEPINKSRKNSIASGTVPLSDIFFMTLRRWPWILLSVLVCVGAAYVYLLRTPNVYSRSAEILIKDDAKGNSAGAEEFANLGLFQSNTNIQNEMSNLKAKDLMEEVVRRLGLDINYSRCGGIRIRPSCQTYSFRLPRRRESVDESVGFKRWKSVGKRS